MSSGPYQYMQIFENHRNISLQSVAQDNAMAVPGASGVTRDIRGQSSRSSSVPRSTTSSPGAAAAAPNGTGTQPAPNATVVVCVLAGTGRADLWVRNNRGQTPLDLCPADQPLRRALIKCCDAAARARSTQAAAAVVAATAASTSMEAAGGALVSPHASQWAQQKPLITLNDAEPVAEPSNSTAQSTDPVVSLIDGDTAVPAGPSGQTPKTDDVFAGNAAVDIFAGNTAVDIFAGNAASAASAASAATTDFLDSGPGPSNALHINFFDEIPSPTDAAAAPVSPNYDMTGVRPMDLTNDSSDDNEPDLDDMDDDIIDNPCGWVIVDNDNINTNR